MWKYCDVLNDLKLRTGIFQSGRGRMLFCNFKRRKIYHEFTMNILIELPSMYSISAPDYMCFSHSWWYSTNGFKVTVICFLTLFKKKTFLLPMNEHQWIIVHHARPQKRFRERFSLHLCSAKVWWKFEGKCPESTFGESRRWFFYQ